MTRALRPLARLAPPALLLVLTGCYSSTFPLDPEPQADLDPRLMGAWRCESAEARPDDGVATVKVARARERVYAVTFEAPDEEPEHLEAHVSRLASGPVLNLRDRDPRAGARPWLFVRARFPQPERLEVDLATESGLRGVEPAPAAVRAALETRPGVFDTILRCTRPPASPGAR